MKFLIGLCLILLTNCAGERKLYLEQLADLNIPQQATERENPYYIAPDCRGVLFNAGIDEEVGTNLYAVEIACRKREFPSGKLVGEVEFMDVEDFKIFKIISLDEFENFIAYLIEVGVIRSKND